MGALLALGGCRAASAWDIADVSGSTIVVDPVNVTAAAAASSEVVVTVRGAGESALTGADVALQAAGCAIAPAARQALDAAGNATFQLSHCARGATPIGATLWAGDLSVPLPPTSSINVYTAADASGAVAAGTPLHFQISAKTALGTPDPAYSGTVHLISSDPLALLPDDTLLAPAARGVLLLPDAVILSTAGSHTVTAVDRDTHRVLTVVQVDVVRTAAPSGSGFDLDGIPEGSQVVLTGLPSTATAGAAGTLDVAVRDAGGAIVPSATGIVLLSSSNLQAQLPSTVLIRPRDGGHRQISDVSLRTAGTQTLRATAGSTVGPPLSVQVVPAAATTLSVGASASAIFGHASTITLRPTDPFGNPASWPDLLHFASDDAAAVLPGDRSAGTYGPGGTTSVLVTLRTLGDHTVTVTASGHVLARATVHVTAGDPIGYTVSGPARLTAGVAAQITVAAVDGFGNPVAMHSPALHLASTDPSATVPADASLDYADEGARQLAVTLRTAGTAQTVTLLTPGNQAVGALTLPVDNAPASQVALVLPVRGVSLGTPIGVGATLRDAFGNLALQGTPHLTLTTSDVGATLPAARPLTPADAGVVTVPLTFASAGTLTVGAAVDGVPVVGSTGTVIVNRIEQVAMGGSRICARLHDGAVQCWGKNFYGALGNGSAGDVGVTSNDPGWPPPAATALGTGRRATGVAAGYYSTCVIRDDARVTCWGLNSQTSAAFYTSQDGYLGFGDTLDRGATASSMGDALGAIDLGTGATAQAIAVGSARACAMLGDGSVKCWGSNASGALGLGDTALRGHDASQMGDSLPAVALGTGRTAAQIVAGPTAVCAILDDGSLKCWGDNAGGQLGQGDTTSRGGSPGQMGDALPAVQLGTGRTARAVAITDYNVCALLDDFSVKCWGNGGAGNMGYGDGQTRGHAAGTMGDALPPVDLGTGRTARSIAMGFYHSCALLDDNTVKCWGNNVYGQLGQGDSLNRGGAPGQMGDALHAVRLPTGEVPVKVVAGMQQTCVMFASGRLNCWGTSQSFVNSYLYTPPIGTSASQMGDALAPIALWGNP